MKYTFLVLFIFSLFVTACRVHPREPFAAEQVPVSPNYSQDRYWAALPWQTDAADATPNGLENQQDGAQVDVFFLHPTTYTGKKGEKRWNGPVKNNDLNSRTLEGSIKFQASIFNRTCRVFAPFYRQAHLHAYFTKDTMSAKRAFDLAYDDVRRAFSYYLANHNQGRPIVIASHSQGTTHAIRLLQEFFDGQDLEEQLVAAYIVGIPVFNEAFSSLKPCPDSTSTGCYVAWRTYKKGYEPQEAAPGVVVTNPLNWTLTEDYASKEKNKGAVLRPFERIIPAAADAQVYGPVLWASKPKFPGSWLLLGKNYHAGDMNIYYMNIRENVALRSHAFLNSGPEEQETNN